MRKTIALTIAAAALAAVFVGPASAGGGKHVSESFGATLAPFPKLAAVGDPAGVTKPGCSAGQEGIHWVGQEFTAPGNGTLRFYSEGFTGDHDIYIYDGETPLLRGEQSQVPDGAPPEEELLLKMKKGQTVTLVACNWLGQPDVLANYEGHFK